MYTLTFLIFAAAVIGVFLAVMIPTFRKRMRAVPGTEDRSATYRRHPPVPVDKADKPPDTHTPFP
ncbi:MAG: hypothetical protein QM820_36050 [Minicystis sp.]